MNWYPALFILGLPDPFGLPALPCGSPRRWSRAGRAGWLAGAVAWRARLSHYRSARGADDVGGPSSRSRGCSRAFTVRRRRPARRLRRTSDVVHAVRRPVLHGRARRDGRLHRARTAPASRRRSRCSPASWCPTSGRLSVVRHRPVPRPRRSWPAASASSSGSAPRCGGTCRCATRSTCCAASTGSTADRHRRNLAELHRAARPRRPARHAGAAAVARAADARRHRGRAAARPGDPLPRRAHDRPRRGQQGPAARVPAPGQRRARRSRCCSPPTTCRTSSSCAAG